MKWLCSVSFAVFCTVAAQAQSVLVHSDRALNNDFSVYKSYIWETSGKYESKSGNQETAEPDAAFRKLIKNAINTELKGRGYQVNTDSPDLMVGYQIFKDPTTIKGFTGYTVATYGEVRQPSDTTSFKLEGGTLFVNLIDSKTGAVIWRGYTSGLLDPNTATWNEDKVDEAVNLLFQDYKARADQYTSVGR